MTECARGTDISPGDPKCRGCEYYREEFAGALLMGFWISCDYHSSVTSPIYTVNTKEDEE